MQNKLLLGNEAIARGAYEAGVTVVSSYPGTPSTEITEYAAKYDEIYAEWAPNEKVALEVGIGASIAGARAMVCMKHVGLNVAADPLFTVAYTGVNGGLVVVVADDPGMHSSQNEQDSRFYARSAHIPMLEPSDSDEALRFTKLAYQLSEKYDTPVLLRTTTRVSHARSMAGISEPEKYELKPYQKDMLKYVMMPAPARKRHIYVEQRENQLVEDIPQLQINRVEMRDKSIGVICSGVAYQYVREALPDASVLKLGMVYPLSRQQIESFAQAVDKLYIIEELEPFIETYVKSYGLECIGKEIFSIQGELSVQLIQKAVLNKSVDIDNINIPGRPPVMCAGCPHRGAFYVFKKMGLTVMGDIGCYTLGALDPLSSMDACVCMGASIGMAHGFEKATGTKEKTIAVIGDSTFFHSGITGLVNIVYNQGNSVVVILDNSTTGMTGHQQHAATGKTLKEQDTNKIDLVGLVNAIGIKNIKVVDPFDINGMEATLSEMLAANQPGVLIVRRKCVLLNKKTKPESYTINDKCKKCKACLRIGCPAIESGDTIKINTALCTGCALCTKLCKFDAISLETEAN